MKSWFRVLGAVALVVAGMADRWFGYPAFAPYRFWFLAIGLLVLVYAAVRTTYYRSGTPRPRPSDQPRPLRLRWWDYPKALICWLDAFKQTYAVEPGLYYTGTHYDRDAPLLVTANYLLTVLLVARRIRAFNVRLLVVDTDGINVWCSAGKGRFSSAAILRELDRYAWELLAEGAKLTLVLPKFSLAGVELRALRKARMRPIIGPLYAKDLSAYLSNPPLKDRDDDRVVFGLQSRIFSWLPGLVQLLGYSLAAALVLFGMEWLWGLEVPLGMVGLTAFLGTAYPILFPWIPGVRFAVKGLWLAAFTSLGLGVLAAAGLLLPADLVMAVLFTFATALFVGLSYTGNSAVSNYSAVRKEIARFLPLNVLLYAGSLVAFVITELNR
ncbi:MAG: hypothetical protein GY856_02430 [bacterium]|nr:hypothetical protein [bacterium]